MTISEDMYEKVKEFHTTFGLPVRDTPLVPEESVVQLRHDLIKEEYIEYIEGLIEDNDVEVADALADILYIAFGSILVYGLAAPEIEVNYEERVVYDDRGFLVMPQETHIPLLGLYLSRHDIEGYEGWIKYVIAWAIQKALEADIPIVNVFNEVHRSNMSKLTAEGTVLYREDGKVLKSDLYSPPDIKGVLYNYSKVVD